MRLFSLPRRSLCALLVAVTATAFSQAPLYYVDVSPFNSTLGSLVQTIAANTTTEVQFWNTLIFYLDTIASQNNGVSSQNFRDLCNIASNILTRCEVISDYDMQQVAQTRNTLIPKLEDCRSFLWNIRDYSSSLNNNLAALKQTLERANFTNDLSGISSDIEDVSQNIQSLVSLFTSFGNSLSSIETTLSTFDNVTSNTFVSAFSELFGKFDALPDNEFLTTKVESIVSAINNIAEGMDNSVEVDGEVDVSSASFAPVVQAVNAVKREVESFYTYWQVWAGDREEGEHAAMSWGTFTSYMEDFFINFSQHLAYQGNIYAILQDLNTNYNEYNSFYTNSLATYLPFLTNQIDDLFYSWFTNQISKVPLETSDPLWGPLTDDWQNLRLSWMLASFYFNYARDYDAYKSVGSWLPVGEPDRFFQGKTTSLSPIEEQMAAALSSYDDQRRYIFSISNTVPYIEGLPTRKAALSDSGEGWLSAWGDLKWSTENGALTLLPDERSRAHTPWNNGYFSTDYFADLLKFIAATNLLQNAYYGEKLLEAMGQTNVTADIEDLPEMPELQPVTNVVDDMTPQNLFPSISDVDVQEMQVDQLSSFDSDARSKISTALTITGTSSGSIVLFPALPFLNNENLSSEYRFDFADHFDSQDRELVRTIFSAIWHIIFYVFSVFKVCTTIQQFFTAS